MSIRATSRALFTVEFQCPREEWHGPEGQNVRIMRALDYGTARGIHAQEFHRHESTVTLTFLESDRDEVTKRLATVDIVVPA